MALVATGVGATQAHASAIVSTDVYLYQFAAANSVPGHAQDQLYALLVQDNAVTIRFCPNAFTATSDLTSYVNGCLEMFGFAAYPTTDTSNARFENKVVASYFKSLKYVTILGTSIYTSLTPTGGAESSTRSKLTTVAFSNPDVLIRRGNIQLPALTEPTKVFP